MRISRTLQIALIAATAAVAILATPSAQAGTPEDSFFLGDVSCGGAINSIDAALLLQLEAALLDELSCPGNADMDGNGSANSIDAGLVLQYNAGLTLSRVQFSLNVTRPEGLCDDSEKPSVCNVPAGTEFGLSIALNHPPPEGYVAFQTQLVYGQLRYNAASDESDEVVWPDSVLPVRAPGEPTGDERLVHHGGLSGLRAPLAVSHHRGDLVSLSMSCPREPRSIAVVVIAVDQAVNPLGSVVSLPSGEFRLPVVTVGHQLVNFDLNQTGAVEPWEVNVEVAARLLINCVE